MVDNPEELTEIEMYRDPDTGKLLGRDPETGDTFPIPFDQISANEATVSGTTTTGSLEAGDLESETGEIEELGGKSRFGELIENENIVPSNDTTNFDPKDHLDAFWTWKITVSTRARDTRANAFRRGFSGEFLFWFNDSGDSRVIEYQTVQGHGTAHIASVDSSGVISYGTDEDISARSGIQIRAIAMGEPQ